MKASEKIYAVSHRTRLAYAAPVANAQLVLRLEPVNWPGQRLLGFHLAITPPPRSRLEHIAPYPAKALAITYLRPLSLLDVTSTFRMAVTANPGVAEGPAVAEVRQLAIVSRDMTNRSPVPYLFPSRIAVASAEIAEWALSALPQDAPIVPAVRALSGAIHRHFAYVPGTTSAATPPGQAFAARAGVCQDFAHVMIVALRAIGLPAAYVSGYLRTLPPPGTPKLVGADAMHAWVAVWCGAELGWLGFDPTNDCLAGSDHIVVAMGRDFADVSPIDGVFVGSAPQTMTVMVDVTEEAPLPGG